MSSGANGLVLGQLTGAPGISASEAGSGHGSARRDQLRSAMKLVAPLRVVWPTEADCARALSDFAASHLSHGLGLLDALIAACAVGLSATLHTFNDKHYRVVPGLVTAQPYTW